MQGGLLPVVLEKAVVGESGDVVGEPGGALGEGAVKILATASESSVTA